MSKKKIIMVMPVMKGGGAERVAAVLLNEFNKSGNECEMILTSSDKNDILRGDLSEDIPVKILRENFSKSGKLKTVFYKLLRVFSSCICRIFEAFGKSVPATLAYLSFVSQYGKEITALRNVIKTEPGAVVISFLQPSIPITLLSLKNLPNKVIISERGNPERLMKHRYGYRFVKKYYNRADNIVFQTELALKTYPDEISEKGVVIPNPVKNGLPDAFSGEREKNITTFCRVSRQKNLPLLLKSFAEVHKDFPDYRLKIIGDPQTEDDKKVYSDVKNLVKELNINDVTDFLPFSQNVHQEIIKDAVYVNSSDYEGMSNAMIEAMAIGMPVVCTDCQIGGAAAVIKNGENGLLVPVGDKKELANAIKRIIGDGDFSKKLSLAAAKTRDELSARSIAEKWTVLINGEK